MGYIKQIENYILINIFTRLVNAKVNKDHEAKGNSEKNVHHNHCALVNEFALLETC